MNKIVNCFYAYPADPPSLAETVESAIDRINATGLVKVRGWKTLATAGRIIIHEVCAVINDCDLFICDLTYPRMNILFELGYAVAKRKPIWITLDASFEQARRDFRKLGLLSTVGYAAYRNSFELVEQFFSDEPFKNLEPSIYNSVIRSVVEAQTQSPILLYLKCESNTEASVRLTRRLRKADIPLMTDDPEEISSQPLSWYALNTFYACGVVAHLIDEIREGRSLRNAKYAFVSGMAYGFEKRLQLLAHAPFSPPVDFRHLLLVHETAAECENTVNGWLPAVRQDYLKQREEYRMRQTETEAEISLRRIELGRYIAENEEHELSKYFVVTSAFKEAIDTSQYRIYVGRKGSGKTANLYQIADELLKDKRNHVCIVKPIDYELEGVLRLLTSNLSKADPGYLMESLWKFLVYTELALSVYKQLRQKPPHFTFSDEEIRYMEYVENQSIVFSDFTLRMEYAIKELCETKDYENLKDQRAKVSEILHRKLLGRLRRLLGEILTEKHRVFVLVDNLDKAWRRRDDLNVLSAFLFGLLSAGQTISSEFQKDRLRRPGINLALIVFLRSDIFSYVRTIARERDKMSFTQLNWNDPVLLRRIIEERVASSFEDTIAPQDIWQRFFPSAVEGAPPEEFIVSRIIPRPRDIIYLCKSALSHAINRRHIRIEEDDILLAERNYSEYAFDTLRAEVEAQFTEIEEFLYEFAGTDEIVTRARMEEFMEKANIPRDQIEYVIDLLLDSMFLGLEVTPGSFEFLYEPTKKKVLQKLAKQTAEQVGKERFRINTPFHSFLEIGR